MMRAKFQVHGVREHKNADAVASIEVIMYPVSKSGGYPADGKDEDNSYAYWTPAGELKLTIQNPALFDKFKLGQKFYADFTAAE